MSLKERIEKELCFIRNNKYKIISKRLNNISEEFLNLIINETIFLNELEPKLSDRLLYIINSKSESNYCKNCGKKILNVKHIFCSHKCNNNSIETKNKFRIKYDNLTEDEKILRNNKRKISFNIKYGGYTLESDTLLKKMRATMLERYSVEHSFQNIDSKNKAINTWLSKYGVDNPFKNEEIKEKIKSKLIEKFGEDYFSRISKNSYKANLTKIEKGIVIPNELLTDYKLYRKLVKNLTEKNYKKYKTFINPENYERVTNGKNGYQLDHFYTIFEGFLNNIDYKIIAHYKNLQMLPWEINRNKWMYSTIEINILLNKIEDNDKSR